MCISDMGILAGGLPCSTTSEKHSCNIVLDILDR